MPPRKEKKSRPISNKCTKRRSYNYRAHLSLVVPLFRKSVQKNDAIKKSTPASEERSTVPAVEVHFTHSCAYAPLCSSDAALREVLCAVQRSLRLSRARARVRSHTAKRGRARTPTRSKLAPAVTYIHCNKLRCTYVQRALHVTHVLAYATGSLRLSLFRSSSHC